MKTIISFILVVVIATAAYFQFVKKRNGQTSVAVKESKTSYYCKASYYPHLTGKINAYIERHTDSLLKDTANFRIDTSEGELTLTADKTLNSPIAMAHIRKVCDSIPTLVNRH